MFIIRLYNRNFDRTTYLSGFNVNSRNYDSHLDWRENKDDAKKFPNRELAICAVNLAKFWCWNASHFNFYIEKVVE